ncbi:MAG TPA: flippase-like domain-containing protein [Nitrospirae bacterium]|nr:flippase-like domain-containing protein [Nitrospirota bacterium]
MKEEYGIESDSVKTDNTGKKIRAIAGYVIGIIIIGGFVYYIAEHRDAFKTVLDISWGHVLGIGIGVFLYWLVSSIQTLVLFREENIRIGFWENLVVLIASIALNYLPMRMGTLLRLRYLKSVHGLRYARYGSLFGIRLVILIFTTGVLGCAGTIAILISGGAFSKELTLIFIALIIISILGYIAPAPKFKNQNSAISRIWNDFSTGFEAIRNKPALAWQVMALTLLQFAALAARLYLSFDAVQFHPSPWILLLLVPLSTLMAFLTFTPGSMGLREGIMGYVTLASGYDFNSGIFAGVVDRVIILVMIFTVGTVCAVYVWIRMHKAVVKKSKIKRVS